jgi:hypothetical protein
VGASNQVEDHLAGYRIDRIRHNAPAPTGAKPRPKF